MRYVAGSPRSAPLAIVTILAILATGLCLAHVTPMDGHGSPGGVCGSMVVAVWVAWLGLLMVSQWALVDAPPAPVLLRLTPPTPPPEA